MGWQAMKDLPPLRRRIIGLRLAAQRGHRHWTPDFYAGFMHGVAIGIRKSAGWLER